ncbi:DUF1684 domain-containing protein [Ekhidna sp.]|jgi:uncharacterized protein (DUF1684 family)|uniref:DUF1684 domain-containing protein n=1 Tax=Ekhidna sp. TaxID=2608089 RepID=UPI0032ED8AF2
MKKAWLILIPVALVIFFMIQSGGNDESYILEINQYWEDRHDFFKTSQASPFVQKKVEYQEVEYFEPNPDYKVNGTLDRLTKRETLTLGNSDGSTTTYLRFANVKFKIKGQSCSLLILKALGFGNQYLLAFGDGTSGDTTYGGGRYLDIAIGKSDQITLDFNKAYSPYCAYFEDFTCPLPPRENLLDVAIEAGEKNYPY